MRLAVLVAHGASRGEIFDEVAAHASRLRGDVPIALYRFEHGEHVTRVAGRGEPLGSQTLIIDRVRRTGRPARTPAASAAPIVVAGEVWGLLVATSPRAV